MKQHTIFLIAVFSITASVHIENFTPRMAIACFIASIAAMQVEKITTISAFSIKITNLKYKLLSSYIYIISIACVPLLLSTLDIYHGANIFLDDYISIFLLVFLATPFFVIFSEKISPSPNDEYHLLGFNIIKNNKLIWKENGDFIRSIIVRSIFIPFMYSWSVQAIEGIKSSVNASDLFNFLFAFGLSIDLMIALSGYLFSSKIFNNSILSTNKNWLAWLACLICYPPLNFILHNVKKQTDSLIWSDFFSPEKPFFWIYGAILSLCWFVYWWSSYCFGIKFSNLSWKGLVETGPYRIFKHPAYLFKNIYWWLYTIPFFGVTSMLDGLINILALTFVSAIYYLRAKTEEQHLQQFSEYRSYSRKINHKHQNIKLLCRKIINQVLSYRA